jgi:hypothetical protein
MCWTKHHLYYLNMQAANRDHASCHSFWPEKVQKPWSTFAAGCERWRGTTRQPPSCSKQSYVAHFPINHTQTHTQWIWWAIPRSSAHNKPAGLLLHNPLSEGTDWQARAFLVCTIEYHHSVLLTARQTSKLPVCSSKLPV